MKVDNPKLDDDFLQWCRAQMLQAKIAADPAKGETIGVLSRQQVEAELLSLEETQVIPRGKVKPQEIATGDWVK